MFTATLFAWIDAEVRGIRFAYSVQYALVKLHAHVIQRVS